jgi:LPS export ABC transporter permease LptF/LPS export ABC transporter permease LptG
MKRINRIIRLETVGPVLVTLLVLTFVVFTREFGRLAELLIRRHAELSTVGWAMLYLLPSILIFTLPFAFLIGTLIGFSRLSSDSEVVAMRAGGVSVHQMLWPVLQAGVLVTLITAGLNFFALAESNWKLRLLRHEIRGSPVFSQIKPRVFFEEFPGTLLYVEDADPRNGTWEGIFLADSTAEGEKRIILADRGRALTEEGTRRLQFHFEEGTAYGFAVDSPEEMTISRFGTLDIPLGPFDEDDDQEGDRVKRPRDKTTADLVADLRGGSDDDRRSSLVELHRRAALSLSGIIFAVLAVTLGIRAPRAGRGYGFMLSIVVAFVYYVLFATGSTLSRSEVLPIWIGVWGANLLMGGFALVTLRRADREWLLGHRIANTRPVLASLETLRRAGRSIVKASEAAGGFWSRLRAPNIRLRIARIVDLYLIRLFLLHVAATLAVVTALVCLFTFFEIIDDIVSNDIPYALVLEYFFFLQPRFLLVLIPISVLIATLVTFGSLERFNQIVAFKSCGISVYRITMPVLVMCLMITGLVFVMQEYILPYANQRQDNLRNVIKGNPVQTTQPGRRWIFGEEGRLYHYSLFGSPRNEFAGLFVYRLDLKESVLLEVDQAHRAEWDPASREWRLFNGWRRDFTADSFERFADRSLALPEKPDFFTEEVRESSKMTYLELRDYISDLQVGGLDVDYLKTELYKKLSFPIVNVIMVVLGVPFALSMGRKGAFYGVAAGILLGIVYWGTGGIFDVLGSSGLLAPTLAAWAPNVLFGGVALFFMSTVRT